VIEQSELCEEVQEWEFDLRKLCDGALAEEVSLSNVAETSLSGQLQRISQAIRDVFSDCTVRFGLGDLPEPLAIMDTLHSTRVGPMAGGNSILLNTGRDEASLSAARSIFSEANILTFDEEVVAEIWEVFSPQIMQALRSFFGGLNLQAELTEQLETYLQGVFYSVFLTRMRDIQSFDWKSWWERRDLRYAVVDRAAVEWMVVEAENIMFSHIYTSASSALSASSEHQKEQPSSPMLVLHSGVQVGSVNESFLENRKLGEVSTIMEILHNTAKRVDWQTLTSLIDGAAK
jgi:hypothetical protein